MRRAVRSGQKSGLAGVSGVVQGEGVGGRSDRGDRHMAAHLTPALPDIQVAVAAMRE